MDASAARSIESFERDYLERVRAIVELPSEPAGIVLGRNSPGPSPGSGPGPGPSSGPGPGPSSGPSPEGGMYLAGWWCDRRDTQNRIVLPNPWDDRAAITLYSDWCWHLGTSLLAKLTPVLNAIHDVDRATEYWKLLFGRWFLLLIAGFADRRLYCRTAHELAPDAPILAGGALSPAPTVLASIRLQRGDEWNQALTGRIAEWHGFPVVRDSGPAANAGVQAVTGAGPASMAPGARIRLALGLARHPAAFSHLAAHRLMSAALAKTKGRRIALVGQPHLSAADLARLAVRVSGLRVAPLRSAEAEPQPADLDQSARKRLTALEADTDTESALISLLGDIMPRTLIEGYGAVVTRSQRLYGPPCHVLHGCFGYDEAENEFVARSRAAGKRIAFNQHGTALQWRAHLGEELETNLPGSVFLSWGRTGQNARPVPSPYPQHLRGRYRGGSRVLLVEYKLPPDPYLVRFSTVPLANQGYDEHQLLAAFVEAAGSLHSQLVLKRFPGTDGLPRHRALDGVRALPSTPGRRSVDWMRRARVVVCYPDTPFIEAMLIGVPIIGLWNIELWNFHSGAAAPFQELIELDVVHSDPEAAAAQLHRIYPNAREWWLSPKIQAARSRFLECFALPGDWSDAWSRELRQIIGE